MEDNTILDFDKDFNAPTLIYADKGLRFVNFMIDRFISTIAAYIGIFIGVGAGIVFGGVDVYDPAKVESSNSDLIMGISVLFGCLLAFIIYFGYYIYMEYKFEGRTVGKMLTKTRTVTKEGYPISLGQAFGRCFARLIPFEPLSIFFNNDGICWHDSLANTIVIKD